MLTLAILFTFGLTEVSGSSICLSCDDVPSPSLCFKVIQCGPHESCVTEEYASTSGVVRFKLGCSDTRSCPATGRRRRNDILACLQCCDEDLCNAKLCGAKGFSDQFGPLCYNCPLQLGSNTCDKISLCGQDQVCAIQHLQIVGAPDNLFESKCMAKSACHVDIPGLLPSADCHLCCNSTLCNNYDPRDKCQGQTTTPLPTVTSTTSTTTTTTASTTVPQTTAPAVCEDVPGSICQPITCAHPTDYIRENCKRTCGYCDQGSTAPVQMSTTKSVTTVLSTTSPTTKYEISATTLNFATTTQRTPRPDAVLDPYCEDVSGGCNVFFDTCSAYPDWSKTSCRLTCGYCYTDAAPIIG